ncbi:unnamed protein product [Clonostachys rosea]|uniref:EVE domain-containing protein n=1 Tax=Bionectria ochroleuca TaxID=29856 RepID=A0ABY6TRZ2_BIOOC|nr:unnamed protein product [Clonostachys rosea]
MPPRKRALDAGDGEPAAKRRSSRQATAAATASASTAQHKAATASAKAVPTTRKPKQEKKAAPQDPAPATEPKGRVATKAKTKAKPAAAAPKSSRGKKPKAEAEDEAAADTDEAEKPSASRGRDVTPDPDPATLPVQNPETVRHDGEWYWLMKAEPESRFEGGVDVRFSIDDLRACTKPEGWDGIRNYAARNNLRAMNAGDKAFFYHSNCKTPGIVGTMEIVREHSEDSKAHHTTPHHTLPHHSFVTCRKTFLLQN